MRKCVKDLYLVCLLPLAPPTLPEWTPQNRFWKHIIEQKAGLVENYGKDDHFEDMQSCLQDKLSKKAIHRLRDREEQVSHPLVVDSLKDGRGRTILAEIRNAISPLQAESVKALAACTREHFHHTHFEHRSFDESGGGNDCTYLNVVLQVFLPAVASTVQHIAEMAYDVAEWGERWKLPSPGECGLRTSEYLDYGTFKSLGGHEDYGSLFTVLFALSDSKLYQGGEYYIQPDDDLMYYFKPRQYSAIVFLSEIHHGVTDIKSGSREMFTNEYWKLEDPPWGALRPDLEDMELFTNKYDETIQDVGGLNGVDLNKLWPMAPDYNKYFDESELLVDVDGLKSGCEFGVCHQLL